MAPDAPTVTDGPFAESAEVAGGYYVFDAENLDEALALARDIPAAKYGAVEIWPIVEYFPPSKPLGKSWLALLLEPPANAHAPGTPEWDAGITQHQKFGAAAGDRTNGGAALHPPATATTVRVRDDQVLLTDGPYVEGAEVANGFYFIDVGDRDEAVKVASMIPGDDGRTAATHGHLWAVAASMTNLDGVFRREWGPAVAALARWSGDFTVAEDAVQEAFAEALRAWPRDGVPDNAGGWIVTVARNRALDRLRRESVRPGKELAAVVDDYPSPHRSRGRASRSRRRTADDVHLRAPRARPDLTAGADTAADLGAHRRRDRAGTVAVRGGSRSADHARQEQDPARQHPATGAARRTAARTHTACAGLYLFGFHRGLLVDGRTVGHPRRTVR